MRAIAAIIGISFILDQFTKTLVRQYLDAHSVIPVIGKYVRLRHLTNAGGAFGLFSNIPHRELVFMVISIFALGVLVYLFIKCPRDNRLMQYALALISGGALGNLYDRIFDGEVVDFLDIGINSHLRWPTFNVADISITLGVFLVIIEITRTFKQPQQELLGSSE